MIPGHEGAVQDKRAAGIMNQGIYHTPTHTIKEVLDDFKAKKEVAGIKFMRSLGIHEAPDAQYVKHHDPSHDNSDENGHRHFIVMKRIHGTNIGRYLQTKPHGWQFPVTQRIADLQAAQRFMGLADRHGGNYMVHDKAGTIHPVDFGMPFWSFRNMRTADILHSALPKGYEEHGISAKLIHRMHKMLPTLPKYMAKYGMEQPGSMHMKQHMDMLTSALAEAFPAVKHFKRTG